MPLPPITRMVEAPALQELRQVAPPDQGVQDGYVVSRTDTTLEVQIGGTVESMDATTTDPITAGMTVRCLPLHERSGGGFTVIGRK